MFLLLVCVSLCSYCCGFLIDQSVHGSAQFFWDFGHLDSAAQNVVAKFRDTHLCTSIYEDFVKRSVYVCKHFIDDPRMFSLSVDGSSFNLFPACYNFTSSIHDRDVSYKAVHVLSDTFKRNYQSVPTGCMCQGDPHFWNKVELDDHTNCYRGDSNYKQIYDHFFGQGRNDKLGCNTHQSLWHGVVAVTNRHSRSPRLCQWALIREISAAYSRQGSGCKCSVATTNPTPVTTINTTNTVKPTITTTAIPTMSTVVNYPTQACDKFKVIEDVGRGTHVMSSGPSSCTNSSQFSSDVLVSDSCYIGKVSTWRKGNNVMKLCKSGSLQPYTAIATFPSMSNIFQTSGYIAAVLVKCELNGIEIAFQDCGQAPLLKHLTEGGFGQLDPNSYYTIATR